MEFTKDTSKVIASVYKLYLERIKSGMTKNDATHFDSNFYKEVKALSEWNESDVIYSIRELKDAGFAKMYVHGSFQILNPFVIQMENRFKDGISSTIKYLADLAAGMATGLIL